MRKTLTEKQILWADNLRNIWDRKKKELGLTQEKAGHLLGWTQGGVGHYLNKKTPLNTDAKIKFAKLLQVDVTEIDPDFSFELNEASEINEPQKSYNARMQLNKEQISLLKEIIHNIERKKFVLTSEQKARLVAGVFSSCVNNGLTADDLSDAIIDAARISVI